jgi:hypothetical protein
MYYKVLQKQTGKWLLQKLASTDSWIIRNYYRPNPMMTQYMDSICLAFSSFCFYLHRMKYFSFLFLMWYSNICTMQLRTFLSSLLPC